VAARIRRPESERSEEFENQDTSGFRGQGFHNRSKRQLLKI
jgi:hypothetical protein